MGKTWGQFTDILIKKASEKNIPLIGQLELTSRCNLKCKMCYVCNGQSDRKAIDNELSAEQWLNLIGEAKAAGVMFLVLTGGEVFLRQDFEEIYEEISRMGFNIEINTNATLITPEKAKWLGRIPPSKVSITMYGASPETYENVCGIGEAYDRAVRGIDLLLDQGINVDIKTTLVKSNVNDFISLAEFAESRGIQLGIVDYVSPRREGCNTRPENERLSPQKLAEFEVTADKYFKEKYGDKLDSTIKANDTCEGNDTDNMDLDCGAGKTSFWVTWDGRMIPCGFMNSIATLPFEKGFYSAYEEMRELSTTVLTCKECRECEYKEHCMSCPAMLESEAGRYDRPAPYFCEFAKKKQELLEGMGGL